MKISPNSLNPTLDAKLKIHSNYYFINKIEVHLAKMSSTILKEYIWKYILHIFNQDKTRRNLKKPEE